MSTPKLYYFDGRGKGEIVRLAFAAAGIEFTEEILTEREQFLKLISDGKLAFNQVPMVEWDGKNMVQTNAIVRYIARKGGLAGKNDDEAFLIDQYFEGGRDLFAPMLPLVFQPEENILESVKSTTLPKYFPMFEKIAAASGTGYLVGNSMTIADVSLLEGLLLYVEYLGEEIFNDYPALKKFYTTLTSNSRISAFLKGPQRKRKNDDRYVAEVKRTLGW